VSVIAFDHVNIRAPRALLDTVRDFYLQAVGLKIGERPEVASYGFWLYLSDRAVLHLMEWPDAPAVDALPRGYLDHVAFACSDLEGMTQNLDALGVKYSRRTFDHKGRAITQLKMTDPTGNVVELNFSEDGGE
jgi:catechol-2,3-dioxygenase